MVPTAQAKAGSEAFAHNDAAGVGRVDCRLAIAGDKRKETAFCSDGQLVGANANRLATIRFSDAPNGEHRFGKRQTTQGGNSVRRNPAGEGRFVGFGFYVDVGSD